MSSLCGAPVDAGRSRDLIRKYRGDLKMIPGKVPGFRYTDQRKQILNVDKLLECAKELINDIKW